MTVLTKITLDPQDSYSELRQYLAARSKVFKEDWRSGRDATVQAEFDRFLREGKTPEDFYRETDVYLYHLTHLDTDIWKPPYRRSILQVLPPPRSMLEFGCGIGSDGMWFHERGYDVSFYDLPSRGLEYLRWRMEWRGLALPIHTQLPPARAEIAFAFDVVEHYKDPARFLKEIEATGEIVVTNWLTTILADSGLEFSHNAVSWVAWLKQNREVLLAENFGYAWLTIHRSAKEERKDGTVTR